VRKKFSISCGKTTVKEKFKNGGKHSSIKMYRNAVQATPIIRAVVENAIIAISENNKLANV
jgi:predicted transcriptional regulator